MILFLSPSQSLVAPEDARLQRQSTTQAARTRPSVAWCVTHSQTWHPTIGQGELSQNDCHVGPGSAPFYLVKKKKIGVFVAFKFQQQRGQINACPRTAHAGCPLHQLTTWQSYGQALAPPYTLLSSRIVNSYSDTLAGKWIPFFVFSSKIMGGSLRVGFSILWDVFNEWSFLWLR